MTSTINVDKSWAMRHCPAVCAIPADPWGYFNPSGDGQHRVDDILNEVEQFFHDC